MYCIWRQKRVLFADNAIAPGTKPERFFERMDNQMEAGVAKPAQSKWSSIIKLVPKMDGSIRFCVNHRRLNATTVPDNYSRSRMDDCIDSLRKDKKFTALEALWVCWKMPIIVVGNDNIIFSSHRGTFRYTRMPFVLWKTFATFQTHWLLFIPEHNGKRTAFILKTLWSFKG